MAIHRVLLPLVIEDGLPMTNLILCFGKVEHPNYALHILWAICLPPTSVTALPTSIGDALNGAEEHSQTLWSKGSEKLQRISSEHPEP